jgi:hypothetical protein
MSHSEKQFGQLGTNMNTTETHNLYSCTRHAVISVADGAAKVACAGVGANGKIVTQGGPSP